MNIEELVYYFSTISFESTIDIISYNLYSPQWWHGKSGILLRSYQNISGETIIEGSIVTILFPMQEIRPYGICHAGVFYVRDQHHTEIGGVKCSDIVLL